MRLPKREGKDSDPMEDMKTYAFQETGDVNDTERGEEEEEADYVVREIDVYFNAPDVHNMKKEEEKTNPDNDRTTGNTNNNTSNWPENFSTKDRDIYIVQFPTKPFFRYVDVPKKSRMKYENKILELDYHVNQDGDHFNTDAETFLMVDKCKMRSSFVDTTNYQMTMTPYAIGALQEDELHLNPVKGIFQMRPVLDHVDAGPEAILRDSNGNDGSLGNVKTEEPNRGSSALNPPPQQPRIQLLEFKRKESERAMAARKSSYAYKVQQEQKEPWTELNVYDPVSEKANEEYMNLMCSQKDSVVKFVSDKETLLDIYSYNDEKKQEMQQTKRNLIGSPISHDSSIDSLHSNMSMNRNDSGDSKLKLQRDLSGAMSYLYDFTDIPPSYDVHSINIMNSNHYVSQPVASVSRAIVGLDRENQLQILFTRSCVLSFAQIIDALIGKKEILENNLTNISTNLNNLNLQKGIKDDAKESEKLSTQYDNENKNTTVMKEKESGDATTENTIVSLSKEGNKKFRPLLYTPRAQKLEFYEKLIEEISQEAVLVRGNWVQKSDSITFNKDKAEESRLRLNSNRFLDGKGILLRDALLYLFNKFGYVKRYELEKAWEGYYDQESITKILSSIATRDPSKHVWRMKLNRDSEFMEKFSEVVKKYDKFWEDKYEKKLAPLLRRITHYSTDTEENTVGIRCYLQQNNSELKEERLVKEHSEDVGFNYEFEEDDEDNCRFIEITDDPLGEKEARYPILE